MNEIPTPRVDLLEFYAEWDSESESGQVVLAEDMREMERDLSTLRAVAGQMEKEISMLFWTTDDGETQRDGTPEDSDAPATFCKAWTELKRALNQPE